MAKSWENASKDGVSGMIHYDTHLAGIQERGFRIVTYRHLRLHAHFHNRRLIFPEVNWNKQFSLNIYGSPRDVDFLHLSWLYDPGTLIPSLTHNGDGPLPRPKVGKIWNLQPHSSRMVRVTIDTLRHWQEFANDFDAPLESTRILYPLHFAEEAAIERIGGFPRKMNGFERIDLGVLDSELERAGIIAKEVAHPTTWDSVILRGAQFGISTPFAKEPPRTSNVDKTLDLRSLPATAVPVSAFNVLRRDELSRLQPNWRGLPSTAYYRLAWREMAPASSERSLIASLLPPGPMHLSSVRSIAMPTNLLTVLAVGFWSSLPIDYAIRVSGRDHVTETDVRRLPAPTADHPLAAPLAIRVMRLNAVTSAYADLWRELYRPNWRSERWAIEWPEFVPLLGAVGQSWGSDAPLRMEIARRAALLEIDAIVAVWLGLDVESLVTIYLARFPQLSDYEDEMWFDANGRKIANDYNAQGWGQSGSDYKKLEAYLRGGGEAPKGYAGPFIRPDREIEYRQAHAVFSKRLQDAIDAGWSPS